MEQKELRDWEAKCTQEEPPRCRAGCPLNVDARGFVRAMSQDRLQEARALLEKSMPLAAVTASLCEAPCENHCLRNESGGSIAIGLLERNCLNRTHSQTRPLRLPPKSKKVAVLGGGPSGLVCAADLSRKGYPVTIFHTDGPAGWMQDLPESRLPRNRLTDELLKLEKAGVTFTEVYVLDKLLIDSSLKQFNALFFSCDLPSPAELIETLHPIDRQTGATIIPALFSGLFPAESRLDYIKGAAAGREAAVSIDRYLQGASLTASRIFPRNGRTDLHTETGSIGPVSRVIPTGVDFTDEEAGREAARCLDCQCLVCVNHCRYLAKFKGYPKTYARQIYNNDAIVKGSHQANTLINSCSLCGQCRELCPNDFSMAELCLQSRRKMVDEQRMPPSAHYFALDEMHSALSDRTTLCRHAPGHEQSRTMFFPGCQLSGVRPDQVELLYAHLRRLQPDTGLWLSCCGAPAHWSGQQDEMADRMKSFHDQWLEMGRPQLLCGCSSCLQMIRDYLPEIKAVSVWTNLEVLPDNAAPFKTSLGVTDPCSSRDDTTTRKGVRNILAELNQELTPVEMSAERTECCGYGGLMANANPELAGEVGRFRGQQIKTPYLTYCIMCREQLRQAGTQALHLLDLMFPETLRAPETPPVSISDRRCNREMLADKLRQQYYAEAAASPPEWSVIKLSISPKIKDSMEKRRILEQEVKQLLFNTEKEENWLSHTGSEARIARKTFGEVTLWVQYIKSVEIFNILSVWSHRMQIRRIIP